MNGDRDRGLAALTIYYQKAGLQFHGLTFDQFISAYDQESPNFVENLGGGIRDAHLSSDELASALTELANANVGRTPDYRDFLPALLDEINGVSHTLAITEDGIVSGVKQAGQSIAIAAGAGAGLYLLALGLGAAFFLFSRRASA